MLLRLSWGSRWSELSLPSSFNSESIQALNTTGFPLPPDYMEPGEFVFARLMYPPASTLYRGRHRMSGDWARGGTTWTIDYPRNDRHIAAAIRRLTVIHARSVEQPVNLDDGDDVFCWPWLYAVEVGTWELTDPQVEKLREYLLRGGFLMVDDDFHGTLEWSVFVRSMRKVFPDRPIVDIPNSDRIFHTLWNLDERFQVPEAQFLFSSRTYEADGVEARWQAIYDDKGRIMVAICHNMDLGDSVEHSDDPRTRRSIPPKGVRTFLNYVIYAMTH